MSTGTQQARRITFFGYVAIIGAVFCLGSWLGHTPVIGVVLAFATLVIALAVTNNDQRRARVRATQQTSVRIAKTTWYIMRFVPWIGGAGGITYLYWLDFHFLGFDPWALRWTAITLVSLIFVISVLNPRSWSNLEEDEVGILEFLNRICFWAVIGSGSQPILFGCFFKMSRVYKVTGNSLPLTDEVAWTKELPPDQRGDKIKPSKTMSATGSVVVHISGNVNGALAMSHAGQIFRLGGPEKAWSQFAAEVRGALNAVSKRHPEEDLMSGEYDAFEQELLDEINATAAKKTGFHADAIDIAHILLSDAVTEARERQAVEAREVTTTADIAEALRPRATDDIKRERPDLEENSPEFHAAVHKRVEWYMDREIKADVAGSIGKGGPTVLSLGDILGGPRSTSGRAPRKGK